MKIIDVSIHSTLLKANSDNIYIVNALLDGEAVPNIISLDLVKILGIKHYNLQSYKHITKFDNANGEKTQAQLEIAQNINVSANE